MTDTAPPAPFRVDLQTYLVAEDRADEADQVYRCGCGKEVHSTLFRDVRDRPDLFAGQPFVCWVCVSDLERQETVAHEAALKAWRAAQGHLDPETLNGLRNQRDKALRATDHTQLADYREDMGPAAYQAVTAYRAAVRAWFAAARDTGEIGIMPAPPPDPITTDQEIEP